MAHRELAPPRLVDVESISGVAESIVIGGKVYGHFGHIHGIPCNGNLLAESPMSSIHETQPAHQPESNWHRCVGAERSIRNKEQGT